MRWRWFDVWVESLDWGDMERLRKIALCSLLVMAYTAQEVAARTVLSPRLEEPALSWLIPLLITCMGTCLSVGFIFGRWTTNNQRDLLDIERKATERDAREADMMKQIAELRARLEDSRRDQPPPPHLENC